MMKLIKKIVDAVILGVGKIHWSSSSYLPQETLDEIKSRLIPDYYVILTRRNNHLSTYFIGLANFVLTGKWGYWSHALMNLEDEVQSPDDFRLIEAVGKGIQFTPFEQVFNVHSVALLKPRGIDLEEWTAVMDNAKSHLGKPYDTLFDIKRDNALSCVELIRTALMTLPNYNTRFARFEQMIRNSKNLAPQMLYDCPDFEVVFESRV